MRPRDPAQCAAWAPRRRSRDDQGLVGIRARRDRLRGGGRGASERARSRPARSARSGRWRSGHTTGRHDRGRRPAIEAARTVGDEHRRPPPSSRAGPKHVPTQRHSSPIWAGTSASSRSSPTRGRRIPHSAPEFARRTTRPKRCRRCAAEHASRGYIGGDVEPEDDAGSLVVQRASGYRVACTAGSRRTSRTPISPSRRAEVQFRPAVHGQHRRARGDRPATARPAEAAARADLRPGRLREGRRQQAIPRASRATWRRRPPRATGMRYIAIAVETSEPVPVNTPDRPSAARSTFTGAGMRGLVEVVEAPQIDGRAHRGHPPRPADDDRRQAAHRRALQLRRQLRHLHRDRHRQPAGASPTSPSLQVDTQRARDLRHARRSSLVEG